MVLGCNKKLYKQMSPNSRFLWVLFHFAQSGLHVFRQQPGRAIQFHGAWLWAGLQYEQEHAGSRGLQSGSGQEAGEADGGERRFPHGGGILGQRQVRTLAMLKSIQRNGKHKNIYDRCLLI